MANSHCIKSLYLTQDCGADKHCLHVYNMLGGCRSKHTILCAISHNQKVADEGELRLLLGQLAHFQAASLCVFFYVFCFLFYFFFLFHIQSSESRM